MADLSVPCPNCNKNHQIADDVAVDDLRSTNCGCPLPGPEAEPDSPPPRVHLTLAEAGPSSAEPAGGSVKVIREKTGPGINTALGRSDRGRKYVPAWSTWLSWVLLVSIAGGMIGFQYFAEDVRACTPYYIAFRNVLVVLVGLLVIHDAWQDSFSQGLLTLVIPPYLLLYATASVESNIVRALFFSLLIGLGTEAWLVPQHSLIMSMGPGLHELIESVNGLIESKKA